MYRVIGANQQQYGPATAQQLRQWIAEGRVNANTLVQPEGATEWTPLRTLPEFFSMLGLNPATPPIMAPSVPCGSYGVQTNGMALTGMIMGILSLTVGWFCCAFGPVFSILGLVFSSIGLSQINRNPELYTGKGLAIAGIVLSVLRLVLMICFLILFGMIGAFGRLLSGIH
jgi:hypothetical protein